MSFSNIVENYGIYDPYQNRNELAKLPTWTACGILLKAFLGPEVYAMSRVFMEAGWAAAFVLNLFVGVIVLYRYHTLFKSLNTLCIREERAYIPFGEAIYIGFKNGPKALRWAAIPSGILVNTSMVLFQYFSLCVYFGDAVLLVIGLKITDDVYYASMYVFPVIVATYFMNHPLIVGSLCIISNALLLAVGCMILYDSTSVGISAKDHLAFNQIHEFPCTVIFSLYQFESTGAVLSIERAMIHPKIFVSAGGVLNIITIVMIMLVNFIGFVGYWLFGLKVSSNLIGQITDPKIKTTAQLCLLIGLCISFNVHGRCIIDILWHDLVKKIITKTSRHCFYEHVTRYALVMGAMVGYVSINNIESIILFCGLLDFTTIMMFPVILRLLLLNHQDIRKNKFILISSIAGLVFVGLLWLFAIVWFPIERAYFTANDDDHLSFLKV